MLDVAPIEVWNRQKQCLEKEEVFGQTAVLFLYKTRFGRFLEWLFFSRKIVSQCMGWYQSSRLSCRAIAPFIKKYRISLHEFEEKNLYSSFNTFFIRKFKPSMRPFCSENVLPAFAEGRYLGFQVMPEVVPVKGGHVELKTLFGKWHSFSKPFEGGPGYIARLCPVDYHRFHSPDDAVVTAIYEQPGVLHSVNPWALTLKTFCANARKFIFLQTKNFGKIVVIPIGALGVGKIVLSVCVDQQIKRGQELGFFLFGGSTVVILGESNAFDLDEDLKIKSLEKCESFVLLGSQIGKKI